METLHVRMLGYALAEPYRGKSYMTEAAAVIQYGFETLKLDLISIYHYSDNVRPRRKNAAFRHEGLLCWAETLYNGEIADKLLDSMTREEAAGRRSALLSL